MNKRNNELFIRMPDPFAESAHIRLIHMGLLSKDGQIIYAVMDTFAGIFTGQFFDDIYDFYAGTKDLESLTVIYKTFLELYKREDYHNMFLFYSIQYDYIRVPMPDPVWRLAGNSVSVKEFMIRFINGYKALMIESGLITPQKGGDAE